MTPFLAQFGAEEVLVVGFASAADGVKAVIVFADKTINFCPVEDLTVVLATRDWPLQFLDRMLELVPA